MNLKVISRNVGFALLVSALFMLLSVGVSVANGNDSALAALLISFTITFTVGIFPFIFVRKTSAISLQDGYMIIFLSWVLSFIFGSLPYALWGGPFTVVNAWFESVSGFTTTGATILERVEDLPRSLLFWRSSTHFIGGLGVVVFLMLIIPSSSPVKLRLANMEVSSLSKDSYRSRTNKTVLIFTYVYFGIMVLAFFAYWAAGMSPFDAINHAFSVAATGGFSTRTLSIGYYDSSLINILTIFFMLMSSIHFGIIWLVLATRTLRPLNNPVLKFYLSTVAIASIVAAISLKFSGVVQNWGEAFMNSTFQIVCYSTTSGFAVCDNSVWPLVACFVLVYCGIQCGMAGSTSGGVKSDRVLLLLKAIQRQVKLNIHPSKISSVRYGRHLLREEEMYPHVLYIAMFAGFIVISTVLALCFGSTSLNALSGSIASLTNVGPALGDLGTYGSYNGEPAACKILYTADMLFGRLEIYPVLAAISQFFSRS